MRRISVRKHVLAVVVAVLAVCITYGAVSANVVSPDGKSLCYIRQAYDKDAELLTQVYIRSTKTSQERQICQVPGRLWDIVWLASDRIALSEPWESLNYIVVSTNGKRLKDISLPPGCKVLYKTLSPDGKKIAFVGSYRSSEKPQSGLFVCNLQTTRVTQLFDKNVMTCPAWSPDSRRLAIGVGEGYTKDYPLWIFDAETAKADDTKTLGVGTAWSPDGKYIACTTEVAKGGSWSGGVPTFGKLGVYDVAARMMKVIAGTDHALLPRWSKSGKWIAYQDGGSISIVGTGGSNPCKIMQNTPAFNGASWLGDKSVFFQGAKSVSRADVSTAKSVVLAEWPEPKAPELKDSDFKVIVTPRVTVRYARFDKKYAEAFARILSEAVTVYERMGFKMPEKVTLEACVDPEQTNLWTDGASQVFLRLRSKELLKPSTQTGVFNIYGMCHELGHDAMYSELGGMMGLPAGVGEGWAHYAGSVVVSDVAQKLGKSIWPEPYDIGDVEGMGRLKRQADREMPKGWDQMDPDSRAALVFYKMETDYGRDKVTSAMVKALHEHPVGKDLMPLMAKHLKEVTGDAKAADWVPESVLIPKVEWKVKDRSPGDEFFADQKVEKDESGICLSYDDGAMDNKMSVSGSAEAVLFRAPEGTSRLDGLKLYGGRYGSVEPPNEDFSIYVCDKDYNLLKTIKLPYSTFKNYDLKWYDLKFDPVDVPSQFYVSVDFQATASKGVYVGKDTGAKRSHSYMAMPYSYVDDMSKNEDWMIRAHLKSK